MSKPDTSPLGRTVFGITCWQAPGDPAVCLTWGGPGDHLHMNVLRSAATTGGRPAVWEIGRDLGAVTGRPHQDLAEAQAVVDMLDAVSRSDTGLAALIDQAEAERGDV